MLINDKIATHEYEGVALDEDERARLVADLGDRNLMLLYNHGTLSVGRSVPEAFAHMYWLETCCSVQVRTLSMGLPIHPAAAATVKKTQDLMTLGKTQARLDYCNNIIWPALIRKLDRQDTSYRD